MTEAELHLVIKLSGKLAPDHFDKLDDRSKTDLLNFMAITLPKLADQEDLSNVGQ